MFSKHHFALFLSAALALQAEASHKQARWAKLPPQLKWEASVKYWEKLQPVQWKTNGRGQRWLLAGVPQWKQFLTVAHPEPLILPSVFMVNMMQQINLFSIMFLTMTPMMTYITLQRIIPWHILTGCWGFTPLPKVNGLLWTWELKFRWSLINIIVPSLWSFWSRL